MTGFKNFLLRGNLVDLAVAVIVGTSFGAVVKTFTEWLTGLIPNGTDYFGTKPGTLGPFLNAVVSFVLLAAVVYFFVVLPYAKAKERFFPSDPVGTPADVALLEEIRDLLRAQGGSNAAGTAGGSSSL
jgi:large conductance mechanosensitive channel